MCSMDTTYCSHLALVTLECHQCLQRGQEEPHGRGWNATFFLPEVSWCNFFFWWIDMTMMWLAFFHKTYKGPKGVGLIRKECGYNVWHGLLTILPVCEGHLFMIERKCGMDTSWAWHLGIVILCVSVKRDDAFGSWVCCVSTSCESWLSTDDSAVKSKVHFQSDTCQQ